jgi:hypothetical protein
MRLTGIYCLCAFLGAATVWAAGTNPVPSLVSFENYAENFAIDGAQGWALGATADSNTGRVSSDPAALEALEIYVLDGGTLPLDTTHEKVLKLAGPVAQSVEGVPGDTIQTYFMLLPVRRETPPALDDTTQVGLVFSSNGVATVFHHDADTTNNVWITLTNAPVLLTQTWVRVSFLQDYTENAYQLSIDGGAPINDSRGWDTPGGAHPGSWFLMPGTNGVMSQISFDDDGDAYVDDLVIGGSLALAITGSANVSSENGFLLGSLDWAGFSDTAVVVYWGPSDGGDSASGWAATNILAGPLSPGDFSIPISGVPPGVTNYFRFAAINAAGTNWATEVATFSWIEFPPPSHPETNSVPFAESFEPYADGFAIGDAFGWFVGEDADEDTGLVTTNAAVVNALTNYTGAGGSFPLNTTHEKVLHLGGSLALSVASPPNQPVRTDMLLKPFFADETPELDSSYQLGLFFNSNGIAEIFHKGVADNEWITLDNGPTLATQEWARISFFQDYSNHMYQVNINESGPISHPNGWSGPPPGGTADGPWFFMPNQRGHMLELAFDGDGEAYLDDLVIGGLLPLVSTRPASAVALGEADLNGFLSITGFAETAVSVYYGLTDGGTVASAWDATNLLAAPQAPGPLSTHVSGLDTNRVYFYRYAGMNAFGPSWAESSEVFFPGVVSIGPALDAVAESPPSSKDVTVTRPSTATNADLIVFLTIGGTATNGEDYQRVADRVVIPAGAVSASFSVTAVRDLNLEGPEQADFTLSGETHALGDAASTTIVISDGPADGEDLTWNNGDDDRNWNDSSLNWIPGSLNFLDGDNVIFSGLETGRVYVGDAVYANPGFTSTSQGAVAPSTMNFTAGIYEFEGGDITVGTTWISGGRLVDRRLDNTGFGHGTITLNGGDFWRQIPPGTTTRTSNFTNDLVIASAAELVGNRGNNHWHGRLELKDTLSLNYLDTESTLHHHWFNGDLIINQDTNFPNPRVIDVYGDDGQTTINGNIVDDANPTHLGTWPLKIGSRKFFNTVYAGEIFIAGPENTYSNGTVIAFWPTQGNTVNGVTVSSGSQLGTSWVTVEDGARLTLNSLDSIHDDVRLSIEGVAKVILPNSNHVETVQSMWVGGVDVGFGTFDASDLPNNIEGPGKIRVYEQLDALMLILR